MKRTILFIALLFSSFMGFSQNVNPIVITGSGCLGTDPRSGAQTITMTYDATTYGQFGLGIYLWFQASGTGLQGPFTPISANPSTTYPGSYDYVFPMNPNLNYMLTCYNTYSFYAPNHPPYTSPTDYAWPGTACPCTPTENPAPDCSATFTYQAYANTPNVIAFNTVLPTLAANATYYWDFGDGNTSTSSSPVEMFPYAGTYHVCLTVFNRVDNSKCTYCMDICANDPQPVQGLKANTNKTDRSVSISSISPNPATANSAVKIAADKETDVDITLIDNFGRTVKTIYKGKMTKGNNDFNIDLSGVPTGIYQLQMITPDGVTKKQISNLK